MSLQQKQQIEDEKCYPAWHNWVSGSAAGAGARVFTTPLDIVRIRRQLSSAGLEVSNENLFRSMYKLFEDGGVSGLFRGNVAAMNLWVGYSAVQFALYADCKQYFTNHIQTKHSSWQQRQQQIAIAFCSGGIAGAVATLATYPFDICRTAFAARCVHDTSASSAGSSPPPRTMREFSITLYRQRGLNGFFAGAGPAVMQIIPYMGLNFAIYDSLTLGDRRVENSGLAGSISGAVSKMIVYPMDTIKKRLQAQAFLSGTTRFNVATGTTITISNAYNYSGVIDCFQKIMHIEGVHAFYRGLVPSVLKTTLASGLSFAIFRFTKNLLESIHDFDGNIPIPAQIIRSSGSSTTAAEEIENINNK